jgi:hypothetical protein
MCEREVARPQARDDHIVSLPSRCVLVRAAGRVWHASGGPQLAASRSPISALSTLPAGLQLDHSCPLAAALQAGGSGSYDASTIALTL